MLIKYLYFVWGEGKIQLIVCFRRRRECALFWSIKCDFWYFYILIYWYSLQKVRTIILPCGWDMFDNHYKFRLFLGQVPSTSSQSCRVNSAAFDFSPTSSNHSAWQPATNCSLSQCSSSFSLNNNCRSSSTPCFDYRTVNNTSVCAPAVLCSLLEPCNNITNQCASDNFVCIINSCCTTQAVCLPVSAASLCTPGKIAGIIRLRFFVDWQQFFNSDNFSYTDLDAKGYCTQFMSSICAGSLSPYFTFKRTPFFERKNISFRFFDFHI